MMRRRAFFLVICGLGLSAAVHADTKTFALSTEPTTTDIRPLTDFVKNLKTFSAKFVQQQINARGLKQPASSGQFVLSRPGQFYWIYQKPYVQKLIASDGTLWVYDPDLAQVTRSLLSRDHGAPIGIFLGTQPLETVFKITAQGKNDDLSWYGLTDRAGQSDFSQLQIGLDDRGIKAMVFTDKLGSRTTVQFSDRAINKPVDKSLFRFIPPPGVDVVKSR